MKIGAIVGERMKEKQFFVIMMPAKFAGFILCVLNLLSFQRGNGFAQVAKKLFRKDIKDSNDLCGGNVMCDLCEYCFNLECQHMITQTQTCKTLTADNH